MARTVGFIAMALTTKGMVRIVRRVLVCTSEVRARRTSMSICPVAARGVTDCVVTVHITCVK